MGIFQRRKQPITPASQAAALCAATMTAAEEVHLPRLLAAEPAGVVAWAPVLLDTGDRTDALDDGRRIGAMVITQDRVLWTYDGRVFSRRLYHLMSVSGKRLKASKKSVVEACDALGVDWAALDREANHEVAFLPWARIEFVGTKEHHWHSAVLGVRLWRESNLLDVLARAAEN